MTARTVRDQAGLDAALASDFTGEIWIDSPKHVGIVLSDTRGKWVGADGNATIKWATGNATIERATGNATIKWADGNATIKWADGNATIERADGNATIERATGNATIERATGNATIKWATGNATIERATGNATIKWADGNATIKWADGNATIERADGNATIERATGNATIERATGNATIEWATGNATIKWATGNATIKWATGNATIERATGNATIKWADGNATIKWADGNATIERATGTTLVHRLDGQASVAAGSYVTVYLYSALATVEGGRVVDMTALDRDDPATWCDLHGVDAADGRATVYKGVNAELMSELGATYPIGETVTAPDWQPTRACGAGLHFSPTPLATHDYCTPARYLECTVDLASMIVLDDKVKSQSVHVVREVDRFARPIAAAAVAS